MGVLRLVIGLGILFAIAYWQLAGRRPATPAAVNSDGVEAPPSYADPNRTARDVAKKIENAETPHDDEVQKKLDDQVQGK